MALAAVFGKSDVQVTEEYFEGKVVWVTGASAGLGEQLCLALCRSARPEGLILSARRIPELRRVEAKCMELRPDMKVKIVRADMEDLDAMVPAAGLALQMCGRVDVLFNNAGRGFRDLASNTSIQVDVNLMNVNYFSGVSLVKSLLPGWLERSSGHVVQISSVQGFFGLPGRTAYAAAKHASMGFYDSLRSEVEDSGISVTTVAPGYIRTGFGDNAANGTGGKYPAGHQDSGVLPEDLAVEILAAAARRRQEIVPAALNARMARMARSLCPCFLFGYMRRRGRKERDLKRKSV